MDCFHVNETMLVIRPDECTGRGVREPEGPASAAVPDNEGRASAWVERNRAFTARWRNVTREDEPPPALMSGKASQARKPRSPSDPGRDRTLNRGYNNIMADRMYPPSTREIARARRALAPRTQAAFDTFSREVFAEGALSAKLKQVVAVAVAHATQCPYCIREHTRAALRSGASREELMEAIWVATGIKAGGAHAHSTLAIEVFDDEAANDQKSGPG